MGKKQHFYCSGLANLLQDSCMCIHTGNSKDSRVILQLRLGLRPNAGHQARRAAGAERALYAVACMPWFGWVCFVAGQEACLVQCGREAHRLLSGGAFVAQDVFDLPL
jgi:hypothetical protein